MGVALLTIRENNWNKVSQDAYKKHFLGLSDNVTYFAEQLETADVSAYHYRVTFKPQTIFAGYRLPGKRHGITRKQVGITNRGWG